MKRFLLAALLLVVPTLHAQRRFVGEPFPLTKPSYGPATGSVRFISGSDGGTMLWTRDEIVRLVRMRDGQNVIADDFLRIARFSQPDVIALGDQFLIAYQETEPGPIMTQLLDANGTRIGPAHVVAEEAVGPRLASNGRIVLLTLLSTSPFEPQVRVLKMNGTLASGESMPIPGNSVPRLASAGEGFIAATYDISGVFIMKIDSAGRLVHETRLGAPYTGELAVVSEGRHALLVIGDTARNIEPDGDFGPPLFIGGNSMHDVDVAWSGSKWILAIRSFSYPHAPTEIVHVDAAVTRILAREEWEANVDHLNVGAAGDGVYAAITRRHDQEISIVKLPVATNAAAPLAILSADQWLLASADSPRDGTLAVWRENTASTHSGVRTRDGRWNEQQIAGPRWYGAAKWGAGEWMVTFHDLNTTFAMRLGARGEALGEPVPLPDFVDDIAQIGPTWVAAHLGNVAPLFKPYAPGWKASTPGDLSQSAIATDGRGFLVAWKVRCWGCILPVPVLDLYGAVLSADLRTVHGPFLLGKFGFDRYGAEDDLTATWNGSEYVVQWGDEAAFVTSEGFVATAVEPPLPGVFFERRGEPPYYGAHRVMMRVQSRTPLPSKPSAPRARGFIEGGTFVIEWDAPPEGVTGYRVEWRIPGGAWTELTATDSPHERSFTAVGPDALTSFRIRAWNAGGIGPYSETVVFDPTR